MSRIFCINLAVSRLFSIEECEKIMPHTNAQNAVDRIEGELAQLTGKRAGLLHEAESLRVSRPAAIALEIDGPHVDATTTARRLTTVEHVLTTVDGLIFRKQAELVQAQADARKRRIGDLRRQEWDAAEALYRQIDLALERLRTLQELQAELTSLDAQPDDFVPPALKSVLEDTQTCAPRQKPLQTWQRGEARPTPKS